MKTLFTLIVLIFSLNSFAGSPKCLKEAKAAAPHAEYGDVKAWLLDEIKTEGLGIEYTYDVTTTTNYKVVVFKDSKSKKCIVTKIYQDYQG